MMAVLQLNPVLNNMYMVLSLIPEALGAHSCRVIAQSPPEPSLHDAHQVGGGD